MIEALEAAATASWDPVQLAVYGDALQAAGDPRGELIAIDLALARRYDGALVARRLEVMRDWLGPLADVGGVRSRYGFLDVAIGAEVDVVTLAKLFGLAGPHLRTLAIRGLRPDVAQVLAIVALAARPRLEALAVTQLGHSPSPLVAGAAADALIRATPRLATIALNGYYIFGAFPHPNLRRLRCGGWTAFGSIIGEGPSLPALVDVELAYHAAAWGQGEPDYDRMLRGVPALRRLDLSRNHFEARGYVGFRFLGDLAIKKQLVELAIPAPVDEVDATALQRVLDRMPALARLELASRPATFQLPRHPSAAIVVPATTAWNLASVVARIAMEVVVPGHPFQLVIEPWRAVPLLEAAHEALLEPCRAAWAQLCAAMHGADGEVLISVRTLLEASSLAGLPEPWRELREALFARAHELPDRLTIRQWWGW